MQTFFPFLTFPKGTDLSQAFSELQIPYSTCFKQRYAFLIQGTRVPFSELFQPLMLLAFNIFIRVLVLFGKVHNLGNCFNKNQNR